MNSFSGYWILEIETWKSKPFKFYKLSSGEQGMIEVNGLMYLCWQCMTICAYVSIDLCHPTKILWVLWSVLVRDLWVCLCLSCFLSIMHQYSRSFLAHTKLTYRALLVSRTSTDFIWIDTIRRLSSNTLSSIYILSLTRKN